MVEKCPYCGTGLPTSGFLRGCAFRDPENIDAVRQIGWDYCPACKKALVVLRKGRGKRKGDYYGRPSFELRNIEEEELLFPKHSLAAVDAEVPDRYKKELTEASLVLETSPKASAALSRRLLQNILREEFGIKHRSLAREINVFVQRGDVPADLGVQIEAIRLVGNFAAHPTKDANTGEILEVEPGEAEWLLGVLRDFLTLLL